MVVAVYAAVTIIALAGMILCFMDGQTQHMADIIRSYIGYAIVVFASYSGNSIAEKILIKKYSGIGETAQKGSDEQSDALGDDSNG